MVMTLPGLIALASRRSEKYRYQTDLVPIALGPSDHYLVGTPRQESA
jgi:hypothetical protein